MIIKKCDICKKELRFETENYMLKIFPNKKSFIKSVIEVPKFEVNFEDVCEDCILKIKNMIKEM